MQETKLCDQCNVITTDKVMDKGSICGSDGMDRVNCWQECWGPCNEKSICKKCIVRCSRCTGTYCNKCIKTHSYTAELKESTCIICKKTQKLFTSPNICGFNWEEDKLYWNIIENNDVCEFCWDALLIKIV